MLGSVIVTRLVKLDLIKDIFANIGRHSLLMMHDGGQNIWKQQIIYLWHLMPQFVIIRGHSILKGIRPIDKLFEIH